MRFLTSKEALMRVAILLVLGVLLIEGVSGAVAALEQASLWLTGG